MKFVFCFWAMLDIAGCAGEEQKKCIHDINVLINRIEHLDGYIIEIW